MPEDIPLGDRILNRTSPVYQELHKERIRAHNKHYASGGSVEQLDWSDPRFLPILVEELGEVARVICDVALGLHVSDPGNALSQLRKELVQLAAMACAWVDAVDDSL